MDTGMTVMNGSVVDVKDLVRVKMLSKQNTVQSSQVNRTGGDGMRTREATVKEKQHAASGLALFWIVASILAYPILFGLCGWDHSFGHPPYGWWAFTGLYSLVGVMLIVRWVKTSFRLAEQQPGATGAAK